MELVQNYKVNLPEFEGPLDLLLYLIRKNDLDIYDIPISFITAEYLKTIDAMKEFNIDLAGEFLAMAAELMLIKSRMLIPSENPEAAEEEGEDPRAELARRLLEYQRFKFAAKKILERPMLGREIFIRSLKNREEEIDKEVPVQGEVFQLMTAFSDILRRLPKKIYHEVAIDRLSISDRIHQIIEIFKTKETCRLTELFSEPLTRYDVVITFLALLEMARLKMIRVHQGERFAPLFITRAAQELSLTETIQEA